MDTEKKRCPVCGREYTGYSVLRRLDYALVCPDCGQRESALREALSRPPAGFSGRYASRGACSASAWPDRKG